MKIALIGSNGQLGTDLKKTISAELLTNLDYPDFDLTQKEIIYEQLLKIKPDLVINTAAYNLVDRAEQFPDEALAVNHQGVKNLVDVCLELDCLLVHYSTDYVFGGGVDRQTPYIEDDLPAPLNQYGQSKLLGEREVTTRLKKYFVIRTSGLFGTAGSKGKGGNFIESIIKKTQSGESLKVVDDQILTPTYTLDLAKNIWKLIQTNNYGLYHITSEGQCSWYEFACEIINCLNLKADLQAIKSDELDLSAKRPAYSVLENNRLKKLGLNLMRNWQVTIPDYLKEKGYLE